ncbi:MAG: M12 family metallo-peptidase, partial [Methanosarcinales archaeon]|nr:M12 family metallo-peptidase [Methanosarcinales archaeon]
MVVDEEYKQMLWRPWNHNNWKEFSTASINEASEYFLSTFQIKLDTVEIDDSWDSEDREMRSDELLWEVKKEMDWIGMDKGTDNHNSDILLAFTGQDAYTPFLYGRHFGIAHDKDAATIVKIPSKPTITHWTEDIETGENDNLVQHEISHLFDAPDHYENKYCIMDKTWPSWDKPGEVFGNIWTTNEWDNECFNIIESNK